MLRKLIFSPVMRVLNNKETAQKLLRESLKDREHALLKIQEEKQKGISDFKEHVRVRYAPISTQIKEIPLIKIESQTRNDIEAVTEAMCDILVTKANDAY
ncbi:MAG: hypothetical protein WCW33_06390 [Candidatus Babeliales bacterium]